MIRENKAANAPTTVLKIVLVMITLFREFIEICLGYKTQTLNVSKNVRMQDVKKTLIHVHVLQFLTRLIFKHFALDPVNKKIAFFNGKKLPTGSHEFVVNGTFFYFSRGKFNFTWEVSEKLV